jgi:ankyrin repeat protein
MFALGRFGSAGRYAHGNISHRRYSTIQVYSPPNKRFEAPFTYFMEVETRINSSRQKKEVNAKIEAAFVNSLHYMVHDGFKVNSPFPISNRMPLHWAISSECDLIASALINLGASVNQYNHVEETPLYIAAFCNRIAVAKILIEKGADVMKRCHYGRVEFWPALHDVLPIHVAGSPAMLQMLIQKGTPINSISNSQAFFTALHYNTLCLKVDSVRYLLDNNAVDIPNTKGYTALQMAKNFYHSYKDSPPGSDALQRLDQIISLLQHHPTKKP